MQVDSSARLRASPAADLPAGAGLRPAGSAGAGADAGARPRLSPGMPMESIAAVWPVAGSAAAGQGHLSTGAVHHHRRESSLPPSVNTILADEQRPSAAPQQQAAAAPAQLATSTPAPSAGDALHPPPLGTAAAAAAADTSAPSGGTPQHSALVAMPAALTALELQDIPQVAALMRSWLRQAEGREAISLVPHHIPDPELLLEQLEEGLQALGAALPAAPVVVQPLADPPEPLRRLFRKRRAVDSVAHTASVCDHTLQEQTAETGGGDSSLGGDGGVSSQQVVSRGARGGGGKRGGGRGGGAARGDKWRSVLGVK